MEPKHNLDICSHAFYLAVDGSDDNPGTARLPFASLTKARDAVRRLREVSPSIKEPVSVVIRGGDYHLTKGLELSREDSGSAESPTIWTAHPGEAVRLIGGRRLTEFVPVTDAIVLSRLRPEARDHVVQVDLRASGVVDYGTPTPINGTPAQLVCNGNYLTLARYPNEGAWLHISAIPQGSEETKIETEHDSHWGSFGYDDGRPATWKETDDLWVHGYWVWDWSDEYQRVAELDGEARVIRPEPPYHHYGYRKGQRFYFLNLIEELDRPGEWFLDRKSGLLYLWPPEPLEDSELFFPELAEPMITMTGAEYIHIRGIAFEVSRSRSVVIEGGSNNEIAGCTMRNFADTAVHIGGTNNGIRSSDVRNVSGIGIELAGGDRKDLTPAINYAENCEVSYVAQVWRTYHGAFSLQGVGNRISHCYVHDVPHQGIGYAGNDHTIEFSEFTRIAFETGDVGVTYTAFNWTSMGHRFRHNYFHNIHGPGHLGCFTIYPDLPCGGIHLFGNIFFDIDVGFYTNSGRGMVIENNIFLSARWAIGFGVWKQAKMFLPNGPWRMVERLEEDGYDKPPYSTRYPALRRLANDFSLGEERWIERSIPRDNIIRSNLSETDLFLRLGAEAGLDDVTVRNNLISDTVVLTGSFTGDGTARTYENGDIEVAEKLAERGNVVVRGGLLEDSANRFFQPPDDSPVWKLGFKPIPFDSIGLYVDEYRKTFRRSVSPPLVTPDKKSFTDETTVHIVPTPSIGRSKCIVRYTLDGSEPSETDRVYSGPVRITETTTIRAAAFAIGDDGQRSSVVSAVYTKEPPAAEG
jgi:hypothetical protein